MKFNGTITITPTAKALAKGAEPQERNAYIVGALAIVRYGSRFPYTYEINHVPTGAFMRACEREDQAKRVLAALETVAQSEGFKWSDVTPETVKDWTKERANNVQWAMINASKEG